MMKQDNKIKKNFIYNVSYQILLVIMPLITAPYVSRVLGVYNTGIYSYTFSIAEYFVMFAMLGVKNYGNRQIAMVRDDRNNLSITFCNIYAFQLASSFFSLFIYICYVCVVKQENMIVSFIQIFYVMTASVDVSWFFFGLEEFKITITRNVIIKIASAILIFVFVKKKSDLWLYTLIMAGGLFVGYLSIFPFLKRYVNFEKPRWKEIKKHIKPNLKLFIPVVAVSIFNVMDKIMLGLMSNFTQVGLYGNTEKIMRIPLGIVTALGTVMMPHMSHMIAIGEKEKSEKLIEFSMIFIMCMGSSLAGGLAGIGKVFAPIFFGDEFRDCGTLLIFLSPTVLSLSWANVIRMQYLIPNKMDNEFTTSTVIGAVVNLIVNFLLIPRFGALGAIYGTLCAETSLTIYQTVVVRKYLPIKRFLFETIPFIFIALGMSVMVDFTGIILGQHFTTLVIQIVLGIIVFCFFAYIYISFSKKKVISEFNDMVRKAFLSAFSDVIKKRRNL